MKERTDPFIEITSDCGRIGNLYRVNSKRSPHISFSYFGRMVRTWGGCSLNPEPGCYLRGCGMENG